MKALTIRQPWAWSILFAGKNIENRSWSTKYRGPLLIHAGAALHGGALPRRLPLREPDEHTRGAIIGVVDLIDVVESSRSRWFEGPYGWVLANPRPLSRPIPCKGRLGLWTLSAAQERAVRERLAEKK
jgi:ASCH domain